MSMGELLDRAGFLWRKQLKSLVQLFALFALVEFGAGQLLEVQLVEQMPLLDALQKGRAGFSAEAMNALLALGGTYFLVIFTLFLTWMAGSVAGHEGQEDNAPKHDSIMLHGLAKRAGA